MKSEPARLIGAVVALSAATFALLALLGVGYDPELSAGVETFIKALGGVLVIAVPLIQAEITRRKVYAPDTVQEKVAEAEADGKRAALSGYLPKDGRREIVRPGNMP